MELFRLLGRVLIDNSAANADIDKTTDKAEKAEGKMSTAFKKIGKSAAVIGTAVAGAAVAAGGAMVAMVESTREYRNEMAKLDTAFKTAGHSTKAATNTYKTLQSVLGETDQAVEAANHLAKLVDNEKDLQTWTDICTGVYATFGASLPIEGLTEAANETARVGTLTGGLADALNWAGVNEEEFQAQLDACNTQQERQALITSTLNGLYKDAATNYKEINKDVLAANAAQERMTAATANFGKVLEPVVTAGKNGFAALLEAALPFVEELAANLPAAMGKAQVAWETVLKPVCNFIGDIITKIVIPAVKLLIDTFQNMAEFASEHFGWVQEVVASTMAIIQEVINAASALIEGDWEGFWLAIVNIVRNIGSALYTAGRGAFQMLFDGLKSIWTSIQSWVSEKVGWITDKFNAVRSFLQGIKDAIAEAAASAASTQAENKGGTNVKAHAAGGILTKPTIFGFTPSTNTLHLGGEAGPEAIAPIDTLMGYVRAAVNDSEQTGLLQAILETQQAILEKDTAVYLNSKEISRAVNRDLGVLY